MKIPSFSLLLLMILGHLVADYTLQGWLASGKQKKWWGDQLKDAPDSVKRKYRNDYKVALLCHSLYWSIIVCLPLLFHPVLFAINAIGHAALHYLIDDAKANKLAISLVEDQIYHFVQIISVWLVCVIA